MGPSAQPPVETFFVHRCGAVTAESIKWVERNFVDPGVFSKGSAWIWQYCCGLGPAFFFPSGPLEFFPPEWAPRVEEGVI